jgi:hypothetical protein
MRKPNRLNACLLILNVAVLGTALVRFGGTAPEAATANAAQPAGEPTKETPFNAADQRKQMITQLDLINKRLAAIEKKLDSGLNVKVTEMPAVIIKDPSKK